ncbi:MAG TPA: tRNA (adenosine(37)-N6)-threonylcarbamoyltransferase complex dimerization subunit type 1 TsaB [Candidatus Binatia bacterium]|jgi:tRNA threonylcarbamoyladenosine biosynthesis protein TsaB|nr:tRNA (adenosine(37)-N6)-threonylcarbamoyltransferase complex dimerization subunit type 1 TsaB [Candidatus Binatia bacterium]
MAILGIDTSTAIASVALVEMGKVVCEEIQQAGSKTNGTSHANHAETLLPLIDGILKKASLPLSELSAIALSIGPGSFTGLRIGLSTVKGLAYGSNISVVGISTLLATAARAKGWDGLACPFLDARKKEVYAALFRKKGESLERLTEDLVAPHRKIVELVLSRANQERCLFIGDGTKTYGDVLTMALGEKCVLTLGEDYPSTASAVARLAEERLRGEPSDPVGPLSPLYLRPSEAELKRLKQDAQ